MEESDDTLVRAAVDGDIDAFGKLYERYYKYCLAIAIVCCKDRQAAEDAVNESFASAAKGLRGLAAGEKFHAWLTTIVRRTANRIRASVPASSELAVEPIESQSLSAGDVLDLRDAINQLDQRSQETIYSHYFSGMSHQEIATLQDSSPAAVHGCLQRARRKLKLILGRLEPQ